MSRVGTPRFNKEQAHSEEPKFFLKTFSDICADTSTVRDYMQDGVMKERRDAKRHRSFSSGWGRMLPTTTTGNNTAPRGVHPEDVLGFDCLVFVRITIAMQPLSSSFCGVVSCSC